MNRLSESGNVIVDGPEGKVQFLRKLIDEQVLALDRRMYHVHLAHMSEPCPYHALDIGVRGRRACHADALIMMSFDSNRLVLPLPSAEDLPEEFTIIMPDVV